MVLSQIEMRSLAAPRQGKVPSHKQATQVIQYVEGESESEENEQMGVEVESGDDVGSVEDIELGGESEEYESIEEDEDEDGDDSPTMNGFIDDEAEEYSEEDESE